MLNIRDLRIDPASLGSKKLLVDITPAYEYKDGIWSLGAARCWGCCFIPWTGRQRRKNSSGSA